MQRCRPYDVPVIQDKITGLSPSETFQGMCEVDGYWTSYEVYFQGDETWAPVVVRGVVRNLDLETEVFRKRIDDIENPAHGRMILTAGGVGTGGGIAGELMRVTARPGAKFTVEALGDGVIHAPAKWYIRATGPESIPTDQSGRAQTDPYAGRHQIVNVELNVPVGATVLAFTPAGLLAANTARGNRLYITSITITSHDDAVRVLTLQTLNAISTAVIDRRVFLVGGDAGRAIWTGETFAVPLRPDRGDVWQVSLNGSNLSGHRLNITGFVE